MKSPRHQRISGITLIELMVVVAIVAILAAVAYPSYESYVRKGRRATAQAALQDIAARQQQFLLDQRRFARRCDACSAAQRARELNPVLPQELVGHYTLNVNVADVAYQAADMSFTASAVPSAALAARGEQTLSINHLGQKAPQAAGYWGR